MTSIAAFLAGLTGAAPQEGQKSSQASVAGAGGLFAALLESAGETPAIEGESALSLVPTEQPGALSAETDVSGDVTFSADLGAALTLGLETAQDETTQDGSEVEAAIVQPTGSVETEITLETPDLATPDAAVQDGQPSTTDPEASPSIAPSAPDLQTGVSVEVDVQIADTTGATPTPAQADAHTAATVQQHATGLNRAVEAASQAGQQNGLATAIARTGQPAPRSNTPQGATLPGSDAPDTSQAGDAGSQAKPEQIKPGQARADITINPREIVQKLVKPGTGQTLVHIQERTGGEGPGASSPPTLTVSVQASAASPGPASANAPHVPVGALAVHIASQASNGAKRFDIRLDPPELGRIEVRLDVSRDGRVMTHLVVERAETLDLLQRDARQLERALQDAGLDTADKGMKFSLKDQGLAQGQQDGPSDKHGEPSSPDSSESNPSIGDDAMPPPVRYSATSGLDIRI